MNDLASILFLVVFLGGFILLAALFVRRSRQKKSELHAEAAREALEVPREAAVSSTTKTADALLAAERLALERETEEARARRAREQLERQEGADTEALAKARADEEHKRDEAHRARQRVQDLSHALKKTREGFVDRVKKAVGGRAIDETIVDDLEAILFTSDIGAKTAEHLLDDVRQKLKADELKDAARVTGALKDEILAIFTRAGEPGLTLDGDAPRVVMIVGVNGAGKTTTIGKLAHHVKGRGKSVLLGAGDTFRAAATEQLVVWGDRNEVPVVKGREGADPASVLFDAVERAKNEGVDVVLCDTAGRLHTKVNLMEELKKVQRVLGKAAPGAPHEVLLVLDATVGQNAIAQAKQFGEAVPITGIVLTKLDGTAKGGVVIGIAAELGVPVRFIGVGEKIEDLKPFSARDFVDALFGGEDEVRSAA